MAMTRRSVKEIRDGAIKVLNEYMKQFGYEESGTGTTYSNDGSKISFKFDFSTMDKNLKETIRENDFKLNCFRYGFSVSDYKALIVDKDIRMRLVGFNLRAPKNPCILVEEGSEKEFVAPVDYVRYYMKQN